MTGVPAPSWGDVQMLAMAKGYAVRVDPDGFHIICRKNGNSKTVGAIADVLDAILGGWQ